MDRTVPVAFAPLGVLLGAVGQLNNVAPALLRDSTPRSIGLGVFALGGVLFVLSTVVVALVGYRTERRVDLADEFAQFTTVAGIAGGLGVLVGSAVVLAAAPVSMGYAIPGVVVGVSYNAVTKSISIGLYGLAGASIAHFQHSG